VSRAARARPFVVEVGSLRRRPGSRLPVQRSAELAGLRVVDAGVPDGAEVTVDVEAEGVPDGVVVTGTIAAAWEGTCRRCLRAVEGTVAVRVMEVFDPHPVEGETYPLEGDRIDLEPLARQTVLLELPLAPLCRPDCPGLCPRCGSDRSEVDCGCDLTVRDPRWSALDELRFDS
jgi:uncharacterized protein